MCSSDLFLHVYRSRFEECHRSDEFFEHARGGPKYVTGMSAPIDGGDGCASPSCAEATSVTAAAVLIRAAIRRAVLKLLDIPFLLQDTF